MSRKAPGKARRKGVPMVELFRRFPVMGAVATGMRGKRLRYREVSADHGLSSRARS